MVETRLSVGGRREDASSDQRLLLSQRPIVQDCGQAYPCSNSERIGLYGYRPAKHHCRSNALSALASLPICENTRTWAVAAVRNPSRNAELHHLSQGAKPAFSRPISSQQHKVARTVCKFMQSLPNQRYFKTIRINTFYTVKHASTLFGRQSTHSYD